MGGKSLEKKKGKTFRLRDAEKRKEVTARITRYSPLLLVEKGIRKPDVVDRRGGNWMVIIIWMVDNLEEVEAPLVHGMSRGIASGK